MSRLLIPLFIASLCALSQAQPLIPSKEEPGPLAREFRAAWIATAYNIDWPSKQGLSAAQQQAELRRMLDSIASLRMNAVIFQVRPMGDAFYDSKLEPWSHFLSGRMGRHPGYTSPSATRASPSDTATKPGAIPGIPAPEHTLSR